MIFSKILTLVLLFYVNFTSSLPSSDKFTVKIENLKCNLSNYTLDEIAGYKKVVNNIIEFFTEGKFKGKTYDLLAELTDTFGPRMTGSQALEKTIDWVLRNATDEGFTAYTENVNTSSWNRNDESLRMITPRNTTIAMLGLGLSIGTPPEGIIAEVLVVSSFEELNASTAKAAGKIVLYDFPYKLYRDDVVFRSQGAIEAAKVGAVASLIRSLTDFSLGTPHTGYQFYDKNVRKIPGAAISFEDAKYFRRLQNKGVVITLHLKMGAKLLPNIITRNTIIDYKGSTNPEEIVLVSGHLDSWDVGVGAMDDGGGVCVSWMASRAVRELGLKPRRTFRTVMFTAEEQGFYGGNAYFAAHKTRKQNFQLMMEADKGTFNPRGFDFSGTDEAACLMREIVGLTSLLGTTQFGSPADTPDLTDFQDIGVPIGSLISDNSKYFWYHHTNADRLEVYTPEMLDKVAAVWTAVSYVAANVSFRLTQTKNQDYIK